MPFDMIPSYEVIPLARHKRSTELYLRALWGKGFAIKGIKNDAVPAMYQSYLHDNRIYVPDAVINVNQNALYYRAAAAHAAAHNIFCGERFDKADFNLMQTEMIGLVEDLRVELLSIRQFPGLKKLWCRFHHIEDGQPVNARNLMLRLSYSILENTYHDSHQWVQKGKQLLLAKMQNPEDSKLSIDAGLMLANDLGQMRLPLNSGRYEQLVAYRDDNRCLWQVQKEARQQAGIASSDDNRTLQQNRLVEGKQGTEINFTTDNISQGDGFVIEQSEQAGLEYLNHLHQQTVEAKLPEWDYRIQVLKKDWCTVHELTSAYGKEAEIADIYRKHKHVKNRMRKIARMLRAEKLSRVRKVEDGDEVDLDPFINAMINLRQGVMPDPRVFMVNQYRQTRSLAITVLMDLSQSTNNLVAGSNSRVCELMRDAVLLLGDMLDIAGESFSIRGFSSDGRHNINVINLKSFAEKFDDSKQRLASIKGQYSTRLGAALRYVGQELLHQPVNKKIVLLISDGMPSDIDVYDESYLDHDSHHAVQSLKESGIRPFCINLDSQSDHVIQHIFGKAGYETLPCITRLPEVLTSMYLKHVRH